MRGILVTLMFVFIFPFVFSLELELDPPYPAILINIGELETLKYVFSSSNKSDSISLEVTGPALNFVNAEIFSSPGLNCTSSTVCSFTLENGKERDIFIRIEGAEVGEGSMILNYGDGSSQEIESAIKVVEASGQIVYDAPAFSLLHIFIVLALSLIVYWWKFL